MRFNHIHDRANHYIYNILYTFPNAINWLLTCMPQFKYNNKLNSKGWSAQLCPYKKQPSPYHFNSMLSEVNNKLKQVIC